MANFDESSAGYNWETEGVYQIEKNDPVEGGPDGISNRQGRQLTRRTRDLHSRLVAVKTQADGLIDQVMGGNVDAAYNTLLKLQNKLRAVESAINGDNGDALIETLQEALGFINDHKSEIESLVNTYVKKTSVADNLTTTSAGYVLSANQGKVLKGLIDTLTGIVNGKETPTGAQQKANAALASAKTYVDKVSPFDYIVDSDAALAGLNNNPNATCVLIKSGTWENTGGINLHPNTKRIYGEVGSVIEVSGATKFCFGYESVSGANTLNEYHIENVTIRNTNTGASVFNGMNNMYECVALSSYTGSSNINRALFANCAIMHRCRAKALSSDAVICIYCFYIYDFIDESASAATKVYMCNVLHSCTLNAVSGCLSVYLCRAKSYINSKYCPETFYDNSTPYLCDNTLSGGWNSIR